MARTKRSKSVKISQHHESTSVSNPIVDSPKRSNNALIAVVGIFAIVLIVYVALSVNSARINSLPSRTTEDLAGQAFTPVEISRVCKLMVSGTTIFDSSAVSASLEKSSSIYYQGQTITAVEITSNGCIIRVSGSEDFIAEGQVQQLGPLYVLIKEVVE